MATNPMPAAGWLGNMTVTGQVSRAWSMVVPANPSAATREGFSRPVAEGDREPLYNLALSSIIGPSLAAAEEDFAAGRTFTLDEWLADGD